MSIFICILFLNNHQSVKSTYSTISTIPYHYSCCNSYFDGLSVVTFYKKNKLVLANVRKFHKRKKHQGQKDFSMLIVGQSYGQQQRCIFSMVFTASLFLTWAPCIIAFLFCRISEPHCTSFSSIRLLHLYAQQAALFLFATIQAGHTQEAQCRQKLPCSVQAIQNNGFQSTVVPLSYPLF